MATTNQDLLRRTIGPYHHVYELADYIDARISAAISAAAYGLPVATATVLGGVKQGAGVSINGSGVLSTTAATAFIPPTADPGVVGAVWNNAGTLTISAG